MIQHQWHREFKIVFGRLPTAPLPPFSAVSTSKSDQLTPASEQTLLPVGSRNSTSQRLRQFGICEAAHVSAPTTGARISPTHRKRSQGAVSAYSNQNPCNTNSIFSRPKRSSLRATASLKTAETRTLTNGLSAHPRPSAAPPPSSRGITQRLPRDMEQIIVTSSDTQTDMLAGLPASATCVQKFDDSRVLQFALRIAVCCVLHRCWSQDIRRHELCM